MSDFIPDNLIAGDFPLKTEGVTIESGQTLTRGALLGKVTSGGQYKLSASAAGDGSESPVAILAEDCDASAGASVAVVYITGEFSETDVTYGEGHTADSVRNGLHLRSIILKKTR